MLFHLFVVLIGPFLIPYVTADFRFKCTQPIVIERVDPIVTPGTVGPHVHTVVGGSAFNLSQTYDQARMASCSSCPFKQDLSNYWVQSLYYQAQNGSVHPVEQDGGMEIWYFQNKGNESEPIVAYPPGFRMVAGDSKLTSYDESDLAQKAINYACLGPGNESTRTPHLPNTNCPNGIRGRFFFPSCWDGVNLDSTNHRDHVAYPDLMSSGICPSTHPVRLVTLFYEIGWKTDQWSNMWWNSDGSQPFVLSNADHTGYGFHADFLNGWNVTALQGAIDNCDYDTVGECDTPLETFTDAEMRACTIPPHIDEQVNGWLLALPGDTPDQASSASRRLRLGFWS